jgi:hypothetical protein
MTDRHPIVPRVVIVARDDSDAFCGILDNRFSLRGSMWEDIRRSELDALRQRDAADKATRASCCFPGRLRLNGAPRDSGVATRAVLCPLSCAKPEATGHLIPMHTSAQSVLRRQRPQDLHEGQPGDRNGDNPANRLRGRGRGGTHQDSARLGHRRTTNPYPRSKTRRTSTA